MELSSKVTAEYKQAPLIDYLTGRYSYLTRPQWLDRIAQGRITYNGEIASARTIIDQGGIVTYDVVAFVQPDADFNYSIVYEDDWLLAVNKPSNLRVHGKGRYMMANLIHHLRHVRRPGYPTVTLVNRLDADTSGVVLLAKDRDTARAVSDQFAQRRVSKQYLALVHGEPPQQRGVIELAIGKVENPRYFRVGRVPRIGQQSPNAKRAVTEYQLIEKFAVPAEMRSLHPARCCSLLQLAPETGRTHQLRVHMAWLGCPIVGDRLYQLDDERYVDWRENRDAAEYDDLLPRHALHAASLTFEHPQQAQNITISAPLATDIVKLISALRGSDT